MKEELYKIIRQSLVLSLISEAPPNNGNGDDDDDEKIIDKDFDNTKKQRKANFINKRKEIITKIKDKIVTKEKERAAKKIAALQDEVVIQPPSSSSMKTFKERLNTLTTEAKERTNVIEKTVKVGRNPKTTFTFTRTTEGILGIEYGDKGNVVFGNIIRKQIIDLLQGKK